MRNILILTVLFSLSACKPALEKVYEASFNLRAARELDSIGDTAGARQYLARARGEPQARAEAENFLQRIGERKAKAVGCIADKKTDLEINQYPRVRHKHYFQLAVCLESAGEREQARKAYKLSENAGSRQPQLYLRRAYLEEVSGDQTAAAKYFTRALELNREYPPALLSQALFFTRTGRGAEAEKAATQLAEKKPFYAEIIRDVLKHNGGKP